MISFKTKPKTNEFFNKYANNVTFQRVFIGTITFMIAFVLIQSGAVPKKYKLNLGDKSQYNISAPREIINKVKVEKTASDAAEAVMPVVKQDDSSAFNIYKSIDNFFSLIDNAKKSIEKRIEQSGVDKKSSSYKEVLLSEQETELAYLKKRLDEANILLSDEQIRYLIVSVSDNEIESFKNNIINLVGNANKDEITQINLGNIIIEIQNILQKTQLDQEIKNIGAIYIKSVMKPNSVIDEEATRIKKKQAYSDAYVEASVKEKIFKDQVILRTGETVTYDTLKLLEELNILEKTRRFEFSSAFGIFLSLLMLTLLLIFFMQSFQKKNHFSRDEIVFVSIIIILTLSLSRFIPTILPSEYAPLALPIFIGVISITILLDLKIALLVNVVLCIAVSFIVNGDIRFLYMSIISGSFAAFIVYRVNSRNKLSFTGIAIGIVNIIVVLCIALINNTNIYTDSFLKEMLVAFFNGVISTILTIGMLPIWESMFNVVTPIRLLELTNPNQPLIKRLLLEAPGTYHHSLMVGNLAEVGAEAIGANSLLARVGAYFHDVGKLNRPYFFMENQLSDNPHDRMTANLSTLVITSHTKDGVELARKNNIPHIIRDIICQHHGTTMVAYFYHKAMKNEKGEQIKPDNFRYEGPKPMTNEAAVVMLADSIEAAVRSMLDKTEGKIEGLIRKIIRDKLEDGQLDLCELTLKDLDLIAKAFVKVFSGYFHAREEYPGKDIKNIVPNSSSENDLLSNNEISGQGVDYAGSDRKYSN